MKYHTDRDGNKKLIKDLETSHLENIIRFIDRQAESGFTIRYGGGMTDEDIYYDEDHFEGDEVRELMNYTDYTNELKNR